jgi:maleylpyruvate isomerase
MSADVSARIDAVVASSNALQHSLESLTDGQCREPSLLPGWSRGHVLTHLARNADALGNLVHWARTGEETPMYQSREARAAAIEEGAGRSADELRRDLEEAGARLVEDLRTLTDEQWQRPIRWGRLDHDADASRVPALRRTEVEVHHVDLDLDYTVAHWPEDFVEDLLAEAAAEFSMRDGVQGFVLVGNDDEGSWTVGAGGQEITGPPPALLAWLLGRTDGIGLHSDDPLPRMEAWR